MTEKPNLHGLFLKYSKKRMLEQNWPRFRSLVESLTEEQIWWRPNEASNSVGNLMLHLNGNIRQWLVGSFRRLEDNRDRPREFRQREAIGKDQLIEMLSATMNEAGHVLSSLTETELLTTYNIQGYTITGLEAVYQVVEHFGMHHGQVIYITKLLRAEDLGFHRELDATGRP